MPLGEVLAGVDEQDQVRLFCVQVLGGYLFHRCFRLAQGGDAAGREPGLDGLAGSLPGGRAAVHGEDVLMSHLPVHGGGDGGPDFAVAAEDVGGVLDHGHIVGTLHGLSAGEPLEAGYVACFVFFLGAHVDQIDRLLALFGQHLPQGGNVQITDAVLFCQPRRVFLGGSLALGGNLGERNPVGAEFQFITGQ